MQLNWLTIVCVGPLANTSNPMEWLFIDLLVSESMREFCAHTESDLCLVCVLQGYHLTTQYTELCVCLCRVELSNLCSHIHNKQYIDGTLIGIAHLSLAHIQDWMEGSLPTINIQWKWFCHCTHVCDSRTEHAHTLNPSYTFVFFSYDSAPYITSYFYFIYCFQTNWTDLLFRSQNCLNVL